MEMIAAVSVLTFLWTVLMALIVWKMHHTNRPEHVQSVAFAFCCEALSRQDVLCSV